MLDRLIFDNEMFESEIFESEIFDNEIFDSEIFDSEIFSIGSSGGVAFNPAAALESEMKFDNEILLIEKSALLPPSHEDLFVNPLDRFTAPFVV